MSLIHQRILFLVLSNQMFTTGCNAGHLLAEQQHKQRQTSRIKAVEQQEKIEFYLLQENIEL